jgi:predicted metal-dependent hydrolase
MTFETKQEVLDWYERQPRALTPEFIGSIPWHDVKKHPLDMRFVPVLLYMRDVETLTDMYQRELVRTPTGKDPVIAKFMERWGAEELTHGEVLNRFLNEAGTETSEKWQSQVRTAVSKLYRLNSFLITSLTNLVGKQFTATHMTFGAIHEMSTTQGYRRLIGLADHPVLTHILNAIIREESAHTQFYRSVAALELRNSEFAQNVARFVIEHFWAPVGQGAKPKKQTEHTIAMLFGGADGMQWVEKTVSARVQQLPGFADLTKINERVRQICGDNMPQTA